MEHIDYKTSTVIRKRHLANEISAEVTKDSGICRLEFLPAFTVLCS
jgi:hypothetical protein